MRLMASPASFVGPVNLGNPGEFTIRQLAEIVIEMTGSKSTIIEEPLPTDDPKQRRPDIELAKGQLGWEPTIGLRKGLRDTIDYFSNVILQAPADVMPAGRTPAARVHAAAGAGDSVRVRHYALLLNIKVTGCPGISGMGVALTVQAGVHGADAQKDKPRAHLRRRTRVGKRHQISVFSARLVHSLSTTSAESPLRGLD